MLRGFILLLLLGFSSASVISIPVGAYFTVSCLGHTDVLFLTYTWTFHKSVNGLIDKHGVPLNWTESELEFKAVEPKDAGEYICVAKGESTGGLVKLKRVFNVQVQEIPISKWWLVIVTEGKTAELPCRPDLQKHTGTSHPTARWSKGEKVYTELKVVNRSLSTDEQKENKTAASQISWASDPKDNDWSIEITNIKLEDADVYHCGVIVGSERHMVNVELIVEPIPPPRCLGYLQPWEACPDLESRSWKAVVEESITAFSLQLYSKLKSSKGKHNLLVSPISMAGLLSHLLLGARGQTRTELEKALFLPTDFSCLHLAVKQMREETKDSLMMANQMFYNPEHTIGEAFVNQSREFYDTVPTKLTGNSEENVKMINDWVSSKTQRKITALMETMDSSTDFVLLNAVYFIGKWIGSFEGKSKTGEFSTLSGEVVSVPILYSSKFNLAMTYHRNLKAQVARFPLTGKTSLYIMVPNSVSESALTYLEDNLDENNLKAMVKELKTSTPASTEVTLPKTKLSINTDLASLLKKIGLSGLFDSPNLCGLFPGEEPVELTDGRHRAFLSLTERGVEAAAASSVSFSRSFNTFSAMQPFVFIVWSDQIECPLFIGRVIYPTSKD
ncbi:hypothetical protein NFI96_015210 [Prochilodus magdalenae]|nr:hypothetical protein NFI96_015210 [Prochilodus magdalenae]